jgi:predicted aldo/keto reductase-like oxidoreductase
MRYREFGNTGIKISALGFGGMRLPMVERDGVSHIDEDKSIQLLQRGFELGINYVDTAYFYSNGENEIVIGKALKGWRDRVYVSTKVPTSRIRCQGDYRRFLEEQLRKLDVDYIDFYHFHGLKQVSYENVVLEFNVAEEALRAKQEGVIKHISFSFHDTPEALINLIDTGLFETVLCQYNFLDRSNEKAIAYARAKGMGTVVMGPVGGGRLAVPSDVMQRLVNRKVRSTPEIALRFVLGNRNVSCALSGMNTMEMLEENVRVASMDEELMPEEWEDIAVAIEENKKLAELYCTGCNYCMPCPRGVDIPLNFRLMNYHKVYGITEYAQREYGKLLATEESSAKRAENCVECGRCETKCPQQIEIRRQLKETAKALG